MYTVLVTDITSQCMYGPTDSHVSSFLYDKHNSQNTDNGSLVKYYLSNPIHTLLGTYELNQVFIVHYKYQLFAWRNACFTVQYSTQRPPVKRKHTVANIV